MVIYLELRLAGYLWHIMSNFDANSIKVLTRLNCLKFRKDVDYKNGKKEAAKIANGIRFTS